MANNLTLRCLFEGDAPSQPFSVTAQTTTTVEELKDIIKTKNPQRLASTDAAQLTLWRVSIRVTVDEDDPKMLDRIPPDQRKKLSSIDRLETEFTGRLPDRTVHVMVQVPIVAGPVANTDRRSSDSSGSSIPGHSAKRQARRKALNQVLEKRRKIEAARKPGFRNELLQHLENFLRDVAEQPTLVPEEVIKSLHRVERTLNNTTPYSSVKWGDIKEIYEPLLFTKEQPETDISADEFNFLYEYLTRAHKCLGALHFGKEMKRIHLIAPILIVVCHLLDDVEILIEDDVDGQELKAHGHFEFVLKRNGKRVCIVEAKKEKMEQGMSQNLLGTEVLSEVENLDYVFGIVTNYIEWIFFRNCEDRILSDAISLQMGSDGLPNADGLRKVTAKICGMLSDD